MTGPDRTLNRHPSNVTIISALFVVGRLRFRWTPPIQMDASDSDCEEEEEEECPEDSVSRRKSATVFLPPTPLAADATSAPFAPSKASSTPCKIGDRRDSVSISGDTGSCAIIPARGEAKRLLSENESNRGRSEEGKRATFQRVGAGSKFFFRNRYYKYI